MIAASSLLDTSADARSHGAMDIMAPAATRSRRSEALAVIADRAGAPALPTHDHAAPAAPPPPGAGCRPGSCRDRRRSVQAGTAARSEEHTSELQSLMRISYAVFCLNKKNRKK